jgi:hypothetical protein
MTVLSYKEDAMKEVDFEVSENGITHTEYDDGSYDVTVSDDYGTDSASFDSNGCMTSYETDE